MSHETITHHSFGPIIAVHQLNAQLMMDCYSMRLKHYQVFVFCNAVELKKHSLHNLMTRQAYPVA